MIRVFSKDRKILTKDVDTWIVEWKTYRQSWCGDKYPDIKTCQQAFTDKQEAEELKDAINAARQLIGMTALDNAKVYKQDRYSI